MREEKAALGKKMSLHDRFIKGVVSLWLSKPGLLFKKKQKILDDIQMFNIIFTDKIKHIVKNDQKYINWNKTQNN